MNAFGFSKGFEEESKQIATSKKNQAFD